jgi:hypothetical protein
MIAAAVGFPFFPFRKSPTNRYAGLRIAMAGVFLATAIHSSIGQTAPTQEGQGDSGPAPAAPAAGNSPVGETAAIAIVPVDAANAATVTGALRVAQGKAIIATSGTVASGTKTTEVVLPRRGVLRVCAATSVHLAADTSVPAGETPGLMLALDHGAVETSFAMGRNSDVVLTPDFRILIGGPGAAEVKVRLGVQGDTCVDNPGANAPYVLVSSVFEGGAYRVQPGQRVMFQHGSLTEVVDQEKEPCGCPPDARPGTIDFPLAQSAGLAPLEKPTPAPAPPSPANDAKTQQPLNEPLVYSAADATKNPVPAATEASTPARSQTAASTTPSAPQKKHGFFRSIGTFFRKIFGAE